MTKNVTVFDSEGKIIGMTYPKRAMGLVKNGRARYTDSAETAIILARSPDIIITSQEDENMSNFNFDEYREKIEAMLRTAAEKVDAVSKTAADMIDDVVARIVNGEERCNIEFTEDGDVSVTVGDDIPSEEDREHFAEVAEQAANEARTEADKRREAFAKLVADAKDAMRTAATEAAKYAEIVKDKVEEKIAEVKEARAEAKEAEKSASEQKYGKAYYLDKIAEIQADKVHIEDALNELFSLKSQGAADIGTQAIANAIRETASQREKTNQQMLTFYIEQIATLESKPNEVADTQRNIETPEERRIRLIANDPLIREVLTKAAGNIGDAKGALASASEFVSNYIYATYGDPS